MSTYLFGDKDIEDLSSEQILSLQYDTLHHQGIMFLILLISVGLIVFYED